MLTDLAADQEKANAWLLAPLPRRLHRCRVIQSGFLGRLVERCACGAIRVDNGSWMERNSRRRGVTAG